MTKIEIQNSIAQAIQQLNEIQKLKLLEFIHAMVDVKKSSSKNDLVQFAGYFPSEDINQMKIAIQDCEKIDQNEW